MRREDLERSQRFPPTIKLDGYEAGDVFGDLGKLQRKGPQGVWTWTLVAPYTTMRPKSYFDPVAREDPSTWIPEQRWHAIYGPGEDKVAGHLTSLPLRRLAQLAFFANVRESPFRFDLPEEFRKSVSGPR